MTIEAVIFDWGGTLTPWHTLEPREAWIAAVADADLADRLWQAEVEIWRRSRDEHRSGTVAEVFDTVGVTATDVMLASLREWWEPHTFLDPDVPALFAGLHERGIRVGVLSNTLWTREEHERIFRRDGVLDAIDGAVYSSEIPWSKPHAEAFRAALDAVAVVDPSRAVFVGDRPFDDIHGAKSVGMHAVLVPHSEIPDVQKGPVEGEADAVVQRLGDVLAVVDALHRPRD
ncbi:putative hydrolase of the HAD superfamily [Jatrophihabitans endophyticus]|uniref:Putative hydrolase of the HAD superfamily n=1 Tax=Jatrophihabitans endophyticus TaxID=1206085 RepID=A0A1M5MG47_9ACTN|nr:HAD family hydrolase [Jatrophihabitans endophyticus]SHG75683.1 putative hydrolase of the HAD superfamily [Jatrophihabitans endophyticus]